MKFKSIKRNFQKVIVVFGTLILLVPFLPSLPAPKASASDVDDLYERLEELEEELAAIRKQKQNLSENIESEENLQNELASEIAKLSNNISTLELNIKEKKAKIKKKETEIKILEEEITDARHLIRDIEGDMNVLEETTDDILRSIYIDTKTNSTIDIFIKSGDSKSFISELQYHTALGKYDQNALQNLQKEKRTLKEQKTKLEDNKIEIEKLAEQIKIEKRSLEKDREQLALQRGQKSTLLAQSNQNEQTYERSFDNLTDKEKKTEAKLDYILQQIVDSPTKPKGYVVKGQIIATEGNNGCSTGPHTHFGYAIGRDNWVNPCRYLPYAKFNWGVCSGSGQIRYPYNNPFYSSRGFYPGYHEALDLNAGPSKYVRAAHNGYYFQESPPCSNSWCRPWGCNTPTNPCIKVCEDVNCKRGKISIYCHVNFL